MGDEFNHTQRLLADVLHHFQTKATEGMVLLGELNRRASCRPQRLRIWEPTPTRREVPCHLALPVPALVGGFKTPTLASSSAPWASAPQDHQHPALVGDAGHGFGQRQLRALWRSVSSRSLSTSCRCTRTYRSAGRPSRPFFRGEVHLVVDGVAEGDEVELTAGATCTSANFLPWSRAGGGIWIRSAMVPKLDAVLLAKISDPGARAMVPSSLEDLDDDGGRLEASQQCQIAACFGVAGAGQHTAILRHPSGKMGWAAQIGGLGMRPTAACTVTGRGRRRRYQWSPSTASMGDGERWENGHCCDRPSAAAPAACSDPGQGQADEATTVARHEVDVFRAIQEAAIIRSPSFLLPSSSIRITILPALISAMISWVVLSAMGYSINMLGD